MERLRNAAVVPVVVLENADDAVPTAQALLAGGVALAKTILGLMALYDIYASCDPQNATVYLVLSIFFKFLRPIFLFVIRDGDRGMPPRKTQPEM